MSFAEDLTIGAWFPNKKWMDRVPKVTKSLPRIRRAKRLGRSPLTKKDVTRGEYNRIIDIINERAVTLNEFRDTITALQGSNDIQFKRIAQMQADFDQIKQTWNSTKISR